MPPVGNIFGSDLKVRTQGTVLIPYDIISKMNLLHKSLNPANEFAALLKGDFDPETLTFKVRSGEFHVPPQMVSPGTVEFVEGPPDLTWNAAIHRHPPNVHRFSSTDATSINQDYECSILFLPPDMLPEAIINISLTKTSIVQIPAEVRIVAEGDDAVIMSMVKNVASNGRRDEPPKTSFGKGKSPDYDKLHAKLGGNKGGNLTKRTIGDPDGTFANIGADEEEV